MKLVALFVATVCSVACSSSSGSGSSASKAPTNGAIGAHFPSENGCDPAWGMGAGANGSDIEIFGCQQACAVQPDCTEGSEADCSAGCKGAFIPDTSGKPTRPTVQCESTFVFTDDFGFHRGCCI